MVYKSPVESLPNNLIFHGLHPGFPSLATHGGLNPSPICMKYLFGPVQSRRLGRSLGIDLFPDRKICNLQCIYCEVGPTGTLARRRALYTPTEEILTELDAFCADPANLAPIDVLTVTAKGEPTLHLGLGHILSHARTLAAKPVAVLTNGATLMLDDVRSELQSADIVVPSLDSVREESFTAVDRPAPGLDLTEIINGLTIFSHEYGGTLWLEILLVRGLNDSDADIAALLPVLARMRLDRIQLNTVVRPPTEPFALPVSRERLESIARAIHGNLAVPVDLPHTSPEGEPAPGPGDAPKVQAASRREAVERIIQMVRRRPCTAVDIERVFQLGGPEQIEQLLAPLVDSGILHQREHGRQRYYH